MLHFVRDDRVIVQKINRARLDWALVTCAADKSAF